MTATMEAGSDPKNLRDLIVRTWLEADRLGHDRPGRPALMDLTKAKENPVRQAMRQADEVIKEIYASPTSATTSDHQVTDERLSTVLSEWTQEPARSDLEPTAHQMAPPTTSLETPHHQPPPEPSRTPRPWPLMLIGLAAAVAVWGGWVEVGHLTGFGLVQPLPGLVDGLWINTAIVLPIGVEAYGGYALRMWLSSADLSARTRSYARWSSIASLVIGAGAQVASHLMRAAGVTTAPWWVTVLVACVPVLVLGLATGLATLVRRDARGER